MGKKSGMADPPSHMHLQFDETWCGFLAGSKTNLGNPKEDLRDEYIL